MHAFLFSKSARKGMLFRTTSALKTMVFGASSWIDMTMAAQKELTERVLALPQKARARLAGQLLKSLDERADKLPRKEWNRAWKAELNKRSEEIRSGKVKCVPMEEARKRWNKILGKA
jgi:putative addiction module component (TIGR02574 family)